MNNEGSYLYSNDVDDTHLGIYDQMRPTIRVEKRKKLFKKYYHSKWANLKLFLQEKKSLESAVQLQKRKTIEQFSTKCKEIYKKKIEIQLLTKKNREMFKSYNSNDDSIQNEENNYIDEKISKIKVIDEISNYTTKSIQEFLFCFRQNNDLMLRIIECADTEQCEILVPFLCHFFYENFYMESTEQEEILYIIYLLLEKEIDMLYTPSVSTFLDQSFVSKFMTEMGNRYEIKHYIDIILNYLIMNLEETNITYNSLDIIDNSKKNENEEEKLYYDMSYEEGILHQKSKGKENKDIIPNLRNETIHNIQANEKIPFDKNIKKTVYVSSSKLKNESSLGFNKATTTTHYVDIINNKNYINNIPLKKEINSDLFNNINEKFIRDRMEKEEDEIMKHFYVRQLRKLQASKNPDLFNGNQYYEKIKSHKKIYKFAVTQFNKSYSSIINFINELLTNLENDTIVPYSIKVISKFIYILLKKRFKNISTIQCNILICQFLFDKLIFPVLQNPDINDVGKDMIISFNTRKSLSNIYVVCKKLVRGELFSIEDKDYLVIFNKFIINNYHRMNKIIEKLIHVKAPDKLIKLSEQFYCNESFDLEDVQRSEASINYDYFKENPNDFMQHKSICFSTDELFVFYEIVKNNKERFIQEGSSLMKIFEELSKDMENLEPNKYNYYVIISDEYDEETKQLLFNKEKKMALGKVKISDDIIKNIKYCISHIISNIEISPNWKWVNDDSDTFSIFQFIHKYISSGSFDAKNYLKNNFKVPLNWYSSYIINNIQKIKKEVGLNDYEYLYDSLELELTSLFKKLRRLNDFLTVNMTTKFILIDHKIKIFSQELENIKSTELNIKTVQFIEKTRINVCLTSINELKNLSKKIPISLDNINMNNQYKLILTKVDKKHQIQCIHRLKIDQKIYNRLKEIKFFKNCHCKNINQFCLHFADYFSEIFQDILDISKQNGDENKNSNSFKEQIPRTLKKKQTNREAFITFKESSPKEIVEKYMKYLNNAIQESPIFKSGINEKKNETDKQKALHIIWNYILKTLCIKIVENELSEKDKSFRKICKKLSWIKPDNLEIPISVYDENLFKKAENHIKKMDYLRTPGGMLNQFGLGVQLINSMFVFMLNQKQAEAGDLLPLIIYGIIRARPKRMVFNVKFIKYFMSQNQLLGNVGYNLIQAESSMNFIQSMTGKQVKMDEQEFQDKCQLAIEFLNDERKKNNLKSINDVENMNSDDSDNINK